MYIKIVLNVFMIIQQGCSRDILPRYRVLSQKEEKKLREVLQKKYEKYLQKIIFFLLLLPVCESVKFYTRGIKNIYIFVMH